MRSLIRLLLIIFASLCMILMQVGSGFALDRSDDNYIKTSIISTSTATEICEHNYMFDDITSGWICINCGRCVGAEAEEIKELKENNDISYSFSNGTLTFTGHGSMDMMRESLEDKSWFKYREKTKKVVIDEGITSICEMAFLRFENLSEIVVPNTVKGIGQNAFGFCNSLTIFTFPDNFIYYGSELFIECENLATVKFGSDTISHSLYLTTGNLFRGCKKLKSITVPKGNNNFKSVDGVLYLTTSYNYGTRMTVLVSYPAGKRITEFTVAESTDGIGEFAFDYCNNLEHIYFPDGLKILSGFAICECDNLMSLEIPNSVTWIHENPGTIWNDPSVLLCDKLEWVKNNSDTAIYLNGLADRVGWPSPESKGVILAWVDSQTGKFASSVKNGKVVRKKIPQLYPGMEFYQNNMLHRIIDDSFFCGYEDNPNPKWMIWDIDQLNNGEPVANVEVYTLADTEVPKTINYKGWTFNVKKVSVVTKATLKENGKIETRNYGSDKVISKETIYKPKTIKLSYKTTTYNGSVKKPRVDVINSIDNYLTKGIDYEVAIPSGRKEIGKYTYKVNFIGNYSGTKKLYLTINPTAVKGLKLTTPKSKQLKVTYSKASGGVSYQIWYRVKGTSTWKKTTSTGTSKLLKNLKGGKTYQVKVRAYKKVSGTTYYGTWTAIKSLKVKK